jgi:hypothetical protein
VAGKDAASGISWAADRRRRLLGIAIRGDQMIDWIHQRCQEWGYEMRKIHLGNQGWPPRTVLDKMITEGVLGAASAGKFSQYCPECLTPDALQINNAIKLLNELDREHAFLMYVIREKAKVTMARLSVTRSSYYDMVDDLHKRINTSLYCVSEQNNENRRRNPTFNSLVSA